MSTFQPRTLGDVNGLDGPFKYQEALPKSFRRANFADTLLHWKPSILRKSQPPKPTEGSPTKTYDSFDSVSVVLENIPQDLPEAGAVGMGAKGDFESLDHNLEAPAYVLANLIPVSAYLVQPSVEIIHAFLTRAYDVPVFIMTVAACMLHALSPQAFAKVWRTTCPLPITFKPDSKGPFGSYSRDGKTVHLHDLPLQDRRVSPEIIVLAALALADVFSPDDRDHSDKWWVVHVARSRYTQAQFNATKRCILHDLDHALMPFTEKSINRAMMREMAKWQHKLRDIQVEQIMRGLGTWGSPSPPASSSFTSTSSPSTSLPSTSLLLSTSLPSYSVASSSAAATPLTRANLRHHEASLQEADGVELVMAWR